MTSALQIHEISEFCWILHWVIDKDKIDELFPILWSDMFH
jgi:hypothetical protein